MASLYRTAKQIQRSLLTARVRHQACSAGPDLKVNGWSSVNGLTVLGRNVNMNGLIVSGEGAVTIGDNFHSGPGCLLITQFHDFDGGSAIPYGDELIVRPIVIKDNVWLGSRVVVLGGSTIGEGAVIQAGSCVVGDIPDMSIAGGHPAKVFKQRDVAHYERLKREGKFH